MSDANKKVMTSAQQQALRMLRENPKRDIYEGGSADGKHGTGDFYVSYGDGHGPKLSKLEVAEMVNARLIRQKWPDCPGYYTLNRRDERGG